MNTAIAITTIICVTIILIFMIAAFGGKNK